jgi:LacI family transcriptional regulator
MTTLSGPAARRPRATMRDVAARAGVSLKTVSRVVNREAGVSDLLAEKVRAAAEELNFQLNAGARNLRRSDHRTGTIGLLLENVANPFSSAVHRAVEDVARQRGVAVLAGSLDETPQRERELVATFTSRRVDGLVLMPAGTDHAYLAPEQRAGTALVFVDRAPGRLAADVVLTDNRAGTTRGVAHLLEQGHERIGFLGDLARIATATERYDGYVDALRAAGATTSPDLVARDVSTVEDADAATTEMLSRAFSPTALFTAQNLVTIGAVKALRRLGQQHEVALVGFDDFLLGELLDPPVTVVAQDPERIGQAAADQLFRRIDGDTGPFTEQVVPTRLVVRGSGEIPPRRRVAS